MSDRLAHADLSKIMLALHETKAINLDISMRGVMESVAKNLTPGQEVGLHVLCCNEYALVTGIQAEPSIGDLRQQLGSIKEALSRLQ
ncbi:hypothetical protein [Deinococcus depolymerans]|uniref:Uncharacterized protein n=1 Tax=Deinococcus depolymerans TaxID=392408 RepID=A0ABN1CEE6_9DEIO